jgi:hypothetical protein
MDASPSASPQRINRSVLVDPVVKAEASESFPFITSPEDNPYTVLYETTELTMGMYEPPVGCYLGAWLDGAYRDTGGMRIFEQRTETKQAVYTKVMHLEDPYPEVWLLQCIAAQAVPLMLLNQGSSEPMLFHQPFHMGSLDFMPVSPRGFSLLSIKRAAEWLGSYNMPMLVAFEPFSVLSDNTDYVYQFRLARAIFMEYAPKAAFVWLTDADATWAHYPGHDVVDWVGVRVLSSWDGNGYDRDILQATEAFYQHFHRDKPILLVAGVSHFSHRDYTYRIQEAGETLEGLFADLRRRFPRIKMLVYTDMAQKNDDFSITKDNALSQIYKQAAAHHHFHSALLSNVSRPVNRSWLRANMDGYIIDGQVYLHTSTVGLPSVKPSDTLMINGAPHAWAEQLNGYYTVVDHTQRIIYVYAIVES